MKKIFIMIVAVVIFIVGFLFIKNILQSTSLGKPVKISDTEGIFPGNGISGNNGYQFTFSISPSGKYLLFLQGDGEGSSQYPQSVNLVLKDLENDTLQQLPLSDYPTVSMGFSKNCWTEDEKYCEEDSLNYYRFGDKPRLVINPELKFTSDNSTISSDTYTDSERNLCSDCPLKSIFDATVDKINEVKGENYLALRNFTIGKSGKAYYNNSNTHTGAMLYVLDPTTMIERQIFATKASSDICLSQLAISPDETKLAFSRQTNCGGYSTTPEVHIFDLENNKDLNLGKINISGVSRFTWSPDSKSLYFVSHSNNSSVLKRVYIK